MREVHEAGEVAVGTTDGVGRVDRPHDEREHETREEEGLADDEET